MNFFLGFSASFLVLFFSFPTYGAEKKIAEALHLTPVAVSETGHILSTIDTQFEMVSWKKGESKVETVLPQSIRPRQWLSTEVSLDGRYMMSYNVLGYPSKMVLTPAQTTTETELFLFDLSNLNRTEIKETRIMNSAPRISNNADSYVFSGRLTQEAWENKDIWTFNLAEYLWDLEKKIEQPTGYYLESVQYDSKTEAKLPEEPFPGRFIRPFPGRTNFVNNPVYSPDGTEIAFGTGGTSGGQLKVYNLLTKKTQDLVAISAVQRVEWPERNAVYFLEGIAGTPSAAVVKVNVQDKKTERILTDAVDASSWHFSQDGKYFVYFATDFGNVLVRNALPKTTVHLYDIDSKKNYELKGVRKARFTPDGKALVLSKETLSPDKNPFWKADVKALIAKAKDTTITVSDLGKSLEDVGANVVSYEPSNDDTEFKKAFSIDPPQVTGGAAARYYNASTNMTNVSKDFYTFKYKGYYALDCKLVDDNGALVAESVRSGAEEIKNILGPQKVLGLGCYVMISGVTPGTPKGKMIMTIQNLPDVAPIEAEVTF